MAVERSQHSSWNSRRQVAGRSPLCYRHCVPCRRRLIQSFRLVLLIASFSTLACSHVSTVKLQPDTIDVGPNLQPVAGLQADAMSLYALFIPIPGVDLDKVVNQMLVVAAKSIGADKVANLRFDIDPAGGIWAWRRIFGVRSARASGIAVRVATPMEDPDADQGPEPAQPAPPPRKDSRQSVRN